MQLFISIEATLTFFSLLFFFCFLFLFVGEHREQLKLNFTQKENSKKLTCKASNRLGLSEATVNIDIICRSKKKKSADILCLFSFLLND